MGQGDGSLPMVESSREHMMRAYDALPPDIRQRLGLGTISWSAIQILMVVRGQIPPHAVSFPEVTWILTGKGEAPPTLIPKNPERARRNQQRMRRR